MNYLSFVSDDVHTAIVATVDDQGRPVTAAIDMMMSDENSLYFLTAKGKSFYDRLVKRKCLALTAMKGPDTMHTSAVSIQGSVRELGPDMLPTLFEKNPYMNDIYPTEESRAVLTVFQIYAGTGEWYSLNGKSIVRKTFAFGGAQEIREGYVIADTCTGCGACVEACPRGCINTATVPFTIDKLHCVICGNCYRVCPTGAVSKLSPE